ncbi:MAG: hypothetical protein V7677_03715 [Motiliproteus sp.]
MKWARSGLVVIALLVTTTAGSMYVALQSYQRLSAETLVAELSFEQLAPQRYQATVLRGDFCQPSNYLILGDQWRLDALFLKWKPWANVIGFDSRYRLDRLEGRYSVTALQNSQSNLAHALPTSASWPPLQSLSDYALSMFADAQYGSSTYQQLDTERIYQVYKTQSGLITRSKHKQLERDEEGVLVIEISHACLNRS